MLDGGAQRGECLALALELLQVLGGAFLVESVRGDAVFGDAVHFLGADLQLGALPPYPDDGGVDGAIVVVLGDRDVVLEAARHDFPVGVDDAQRAVAVGDGRHDDAEADHVRELFEGDRLAIDLGEDGPGRLHPRRDARALDAFGFEPLGEFLPDGRDGLCEFRLHLVETLGDGAIGLGLQDLERQRLELGAHVLHTHAAGERRIDFHGFGGDPLLLFGRHEFERAHVVQAVGELDQQHTDVGRDGEQELAEVLGLRFLAGDELQALDLGQAIDDGTDLGAEDLVDFGAGGVGILDGVMQQRHGDRGVVEPEFGEDGGDFERMVEVGVAGGALLAAMLLHGIDVSLVEQRLVGVRVIGLDPLDELILTHHLECRAPCGRTLRTPASTKKAPDLSPAPLEYMSFVLGSNRAIAPFDHRSHGLLP